jgi:hypothetical protein
MHPARTRVPAGITAGPARAAGGTAQAGVVPLANRLLTVLVVV